MTSIALKAVNAASMDQFRGRSSDTMQDMYSSLAFRSKPLPLLPASDEDIARFRSVVYAHPSENRVLYQIADSRRIKPLIKHLNISCFSPSFIDRSCLNNLANILPLLKNLEEFVFFNAGSYCEIIGPASFIFDKCTDLNLRLLEWYSCVQDEAPMAEFLRTQIMISTLNITWTNTEVKLDAVPVLHTLIGDTATVMAFLPRRPVIQLQWMSVGDENKETLEEAARYMGCICEMTLDIQRTSLFPYIAEKLRLVTILELILYEKDVEPLYEALQLLTNLRTIIFSSRCCTLFGSLYARDRKRKQIVDQVFDSNSNIEKVYIQMPSLNSCENKPDADVSQDGLRYYGYYTTVTGSLVSWHVSEDHVFSWKQGYVQVPI